MKYRYLQINLWIFLLLLLVSFSSPVVSDDSRHKAVVHDKQAGASNVTDEFEMLISRARHCQEAMNRPELADSMLQHLIELAEMSYDKKKILLAYNAYLECMDVDAFNKKRLSYIKRIEPVARLVSDDSILWRTYNNISSVCCGVYDYDKALEYAYRSLTFAESLRSEEMRARTYLSIGRSLQGKNRPIEAFRNYLQAMNIAESTGDHGLLMLSYNVLSRFFHLSKDFDKAIDYKLKQAALIRQQSPLDSVALMWINFELEEITFNSMRTMNEVNISHLLQYSGASGREKLREFTLTLYRSYLINTSQIGKLRELYLVRYKEEFNQLSERDPAMYSRIMALVKEYEHDSDSAMIYFRKAEQYLLTNSNKVFMSNFYYRYGQFMERQGKKKEALVLFKKALNLASETPFLEYQLNASRELEAAYAELGDYREAYHYSGLNNLLADSMNKLSKRDDLLLLELDNTAKLRDEALKREQLATDRRHNIQYTAITIVVGIVFIILIMMGSFRVPKWMIEMLGFVSFILLFEFIVLITDNWIHHITHGEPWKVLAIKIVLIGFLMPMHHWTERKVIHYLVHHRLINFRDNWLRRFFKEFLSKEETPPA